MNWHSLSKEEIFTELATQATGISSSEAEKRLKQCGHNILPEKKLPGILIIFLSQFLSPLIYVPLAASVVSIFLKDYRDAFFIFIVLFINSVIGAIQEYSAQKSALALKKIIPRNTMVLRNGRAITIPAANLVQGDIVVITSGDKIPADIRLISSNGLTVDESMLTGESVAIAKDSEAMISESATIGDRLNMLFAGTIATHGRATGMVVATGNKMEIGSIAISVADTEEVQPPLVQRVEKLSLRITFMTLAIILFIFVFEIIKKGFSTEIFAIAVALAVSAIPKGLPVAITVALAIGMQRIAKVGVIIRKLVSVETLGSCTFIASDKTGTLTINKLTAKKIILPDGKKFEVEGEGMEVNGNITSLTGHDKEELEELCHAGFLANEAALHFQDGEWKHTGDMVDVAFLVLAKKYGLVLEEEKKMHPQHDDIPYEPENGFSASINIKDGIPNIYVKGSVEKLQGMCSNIDKEEILRQADKLASEGYRVLGLASGTLERIPDEDFSEAHLKGLRFLGMVGMIDPLRPEAKAAVEQCYNAGIEVAMITGDHPATAFAIARELGLCKNKGQVITGKILSEIRTERDFDELIKNTRVFARISPGQKEQIIKSLIRLGHFVAVTGDGINDAPALQAAHVGVAMGKHGTDVARETADIILTDDNFASIVHGIEKGRIVYNNIRKVVFMVMSTGVSEVLLFLLALFAGLPMPLLAVQLLWLNLITNGVQDVALAFEPREGDELKQKPRPPKEPIFNRLMIERIAISAIFMSIISFLIFNWMLRHGYSVEASRNGVLLVMVIFENIQVLNSRSETKSIFRQRFFTNMLLIIGMITAQGLHMVAMYIPIFQDVLKIKPVSLKEWGILIVLSLVVLAISEVHKLFRGKIITQRCD